MPATLRTTVVQGPEVRRLRRARRLLTVVKLAMVLPWLMLLPLLLSLLFESFLPVPVAEVLTVLLVACLLVPFGLWPLERWMERRTHEARMAVFPLCISALSALRAGWNVEWCVSSGWKTPERLTSRGTFKRRYEWALEYRGDQLFITELPESEHDEDDEEEY